MSRTGLIAKKLGMTSMFNEQGKRLTLTLLKIDSCQVISSRTEERDGYNAVIVGAENSKPSRVKKPLRSWFAGLNIESKSQIKEFRVSKDNLLESGAELKPSYFSKNQYIDVIGTSKGKGFAGVMKRHNFGGLEATHGVSVVHRSHGSTGQCQDPGRVFKGKRMAGHLGNDRVTIQNLQVIEIDDEKGLLIISGNVPGHNGSVVYVRDAIKKTSSVSA